MNDYETVCPRCGRVHLRHAMSDHCYACDKDQDFNEREFWKKVKEAGK